MFHGKGGYDWETVYNFPIWLRKYTHNKIYKWYAKDQEPDDNMEKVKQQAIQGGYTRNNPTKVQVPDYATRLTQKPKS